MIGFNQVANTVVTADTKKGKLLSDFLKGEKKYIETLKIINDFAEQTRETNYLIEPDLYVLFGNVSEIIQAHQHYLSHIYELLEVVEDTDDLQNIETYKILSGLADVLQLYENFHPNSHQRIRLMKEILEKLPEFRAFYDDKLSHPKYRGLAMENWFNRVYERFISYQTFVSTIAIANENNDESEQLNELYEGVYTVSGKIEDMLSHEEIIYQDDYKKLENLCNSFQNKMNSEFVQYGRRIVQQGTFKIGSKKKKEHLVFLLNDRIIVATREKLKVANDYYLKETIVIDLSIENEHIIEIKDTLSGDAFLINFENSTDKKSWFKLLKHLVNLYETRRESNVSTEEIAPFTLQNHILEEGNEEDDEPELNIEPNTQLEYLTPNDEASGTEEVQETPEEREKRLDLRKKISLEIYTTENRYVKDLSIIFDVLINPLRESGIITPGEETILFSNLSTLENLNREYLFVKIKAEIDSVRAANINIAEARIGGIIGEFSNHLYQYQTYCVNQTYSLALLDELFNENQEFLNFVNEQMQDPRCRGLDLQSWLVKPMQRLMKYPLLLRELLRTTLKSDNEYQILLDSCEKVETSVRLVNETKLAAEERAHRLNEQLTSIANSFDGSIIEHNLVKFGRYLVKNGFCNLVSGKKMNKLLPVYIYLLNDSLLLATFKKVHYRVVQFIDIRVLQSIDLGDVGRAVNAFEVINTSTDQRLVLSFETLKLKREWLDMIKTQEKDFKIQRLSRFKFDQKQNDSDSIKVNNPSIKSSRSSPRLCTSAPNKPPPPTPTSDELSKSPMSASAGFTFSTISSPSDTPRKSRSFALGSGRLSREILTQDEDDYQDYMP
eukprot:TRINITY_DN7442_c0_g1_i1.p1 TRINITY_DN7442_c0_g1~~TRINITY_DN7442_c0_g1_i1.p1  ORF type:complete len:839 (-),score=171.46 TRINITY_DN7442_c0_g1_i1:53-2569(-)